MDEAVATRLGALLGAPNPGERRMDVATSRKVGDAVVIPWGISEVPGKVAEIYGSGRGRHVVVALQPEESGYVVDEPTTVAFPIDLVRPAGVAA